VQSDHQTITMLTRVAVFLCLASISIAADSAEWQKRVIYQVLTDRFATSNGDSPDCNLREYCGGTWAGITSKLDYIKDMGFDAIWISPLPVNSPGGYHGYWAEDMSKLNPHFGTEDDLLKLVQACHSRDMLIMVDVVANHMGELTDITKAVPFNKTEHYHACSLCPPGCSILNYRNQTEVELCRVYGLLDLDQSNDFVSNYLQRWVRNIVQKYNIDGLRIDTFAEVDNPFWVKYISSSGVFVIAEISDPRVAYVGPYQAPRGPAPSVLSYPMFHTISSVFGEGKPMKLIKGMRSSYKKYMGNMNLLGNFVDNHDQPRFLNKQKDLTLHKSALLYSMYSSGIPIVYYGTEQSFSGGNDPDCREPMWKSKYDVNNDMYKFVQKITKHRQSSQVYSQDHVEHHVGGHLYVFSRGKVLVALTNVGTTGQPINVTLTSHPFQNGQKVCNILMDNDCTTIAGYLQLALNHGESKVYQPQQ